MKICELANNEKEHFDILFNKMILSMSKKKNRMNWIILQRKAKEFGYNLGYEHFKASGGWLTF